jgi:hypothetical protein
MKDQIDKELLMWAAKVEPSLDHLENLSSRIHDEIVRERMLADNQTHYSYAKRYFIAIACAAAALVTAVVWFSTFDVKNGNGGDSVAITNISSERLNASADLVREMNSLFDENWRWIAESAGDVDMEISPLHGGISVDTRSMLVRITLVAKETGCSSWNELWYSDVVMRSEEAIEICSGQSHDNNLALWVLPADGKESG